MQNSLEFLASTHSLLDNQFKNADQCFKQYLQMAIYSDLDAFEPVIPSLNLKDETGIPIILFLDNPLPQSQTFQKLYFSLIRKLNELSQKSKYKIIVVDRKGNHEYFYILLNILKMIPMRYIQSLTIFVLTQKILKRQELKNNPFQNYISNITVLVNSIDKLKCMKMQSIVQALKTLDIENLTSKSFQKGTSTFRSNFVNRNRKNSINLDQVIQTKRHPNIASYELKDGVPKVLIQLLQTLKPKLETTGIFRISPSIQQQKIYLPCLDKQDIQTLSKIQNPHTITSLVKKIFSRLQPPIFSYELYQFITMQEFNGQSGLYLIISILKKIPQQNYLSLKYLSEYILKNVLKFSESNKMKAATLAVILAPVLLRSYNPSHDDLKYMNKMILVVKTMIQSYEFIFHQPVKNPEVLPKQIIKQKLANNKQEQINSDKVEKQIEQSESVSLSSEVSELSFNRQMDKTQSITVQINQYDFVQSSPNKSAISQTFQLSEQQNAEIILHPITKKRSVIESNQIEQSSYQIQKISKIITIKSSQVLEQKLEQKQKVAESDSMSDFQNLEVDDI